MQIEVNYIAQLSPKTVDVKAELLFFYGPPPDFRHELIVANYVAASVHEANQQSTLGVRQG